MPTYLRPLLDIEHWSATTALPADPALLDSMTPLLDGHRATHDIIGMMLSAGYELEPVVSALDQLDQQGWLREATPATQVLSAEECDRYAPQLRMYAAFGQTGSYSRQPDAGLAAQIALKQALVVVVDCGSIGRRLLQLLAQLGVGQLARIDGPEYAAVPDMATEPFAETIHRINPHVTYRAIDQAEATPAAWHEARPNLLLYCPDQFNAARAAQINALCIEQRLPWLSLRWRRLALEIGPLVVPGETACYECYTRRLAATGALQNAGEAAHEAEAVPNFPNGVEWLGLEVIKQLTAISEPITRGRLWRLNLASGQTETHTVLKLPRCPACGVHLRRPLRKLWEE